MRNLADVRETAKRCGNHFFDRESMRTFNSRLCESLTRLSPKDGSVWFVTSERSDDSVYGGRRYTVRRASLEYLRLPWARRYEAPSWSWYNEYGETANPANLRLTQGYVWGMYFDIQTIGEFMEHASRIEAYKALVKAMLA